jgi:hypothetical protein
MGGRFRLISVKTRRSSVSVASKGVTGAEVEEFKLEELKRGSWWHSGIFAKECAKG